jgi:tripartite motif-containing protein 71
MYVTDTDNNRIQKFDSNGIFIGQQGTLGSSNGQFNIPASIATDTLGNIYVADNGNSRIQKFDSNGNFITKWDYLSPKNIAIDLLGNVYLTDDNTNRIQVFAPTTSIYIPTRI